MAEPTQLETLTVTHTAPVASLVVAWLGAERAEVLLTRGGVWLQWHGRSCRVTNRHQHAPAGARLTLRFPPAEGYSDVTISPADICYEDTWLLVLHKHAGWYSGATPWDMQGNALAALHRFLQQRDGICPPLHLAHQLDRGTSGLLLCSKHVHANAPMQAAFAGGAVEKQYRCLCAGEPAEECFTVRSGHGRSRGGRWRLYPLEEVGTRLPGGSRVRTAHTSFSVVQRQGDAALLQVTPHTGRTHQIRLHSASVGHPLVGDTRYGGSATLRGEAVAWPCLHAAALRLHHPITGAVLALHAPLPAWAEERA